MDVGVYYHILEIGIVYEKGRLKGKLWHFGEKKRLHDECDFWLKIIKMIDLPQRREEEDKILFQEMEIIAKKYNNSNYHRILELKETLINEQRSHEYRKEDMLLVNNFLSNLLKDMKIELNKFNGKAKVYRIMASMHNLPKIFHGKDTLGGGAVIRMEDAIRYASWSLPDDMKEKYMEYIQ